MADKIPGIKSWIRVNTANEDDIQNAVASVPDEDRIDADTILRGMDSGTRVVVYVTDEEESKYLPESMFEALYLNPDEGIKEDDAAENGEVEMFELQSEVERSSLSKWADRIIPGIDVVHLQHRTRVGDLVLHRPGSPVFEVFTRSENVSWDKAQMRLQLLQVASSAPRFSGDEKTTTLDRAKQFSEWVTGY